MRQLDLLDAPGWHWTARASDSTALEHGSSQAGSVERGPGAAPGTIVVGGSIREQLPATVVRPRPPG